MQFIEDGTYSINSYNALFITTKGLYGDAFYMYNNKTEFISEKIRVVTEQVEYYRNQRG